MSSIRGRLFRGAVLFAMAVQVMAGPPKEKAASQPITRWLTAGPAAMTPLAFGSMKESDRAALLLGTATLDPEGLWPQADARLTLASSEVQAWRAAQAPEGKLSFAAPSKGTALAYAATYLDSARWVKATLVLASNSPLAVYFDGKQVAKTTEIKSGKEAQETTAELVLPRGLHRLLIASLKEGSREWTIKASLRLPEGSDLPLPQATTDPRHPLAEEDVMAAPFVQEIALSADGSRVATVVRTTDLAADKRLTYLQVRQTSDGALLADLPVAAGLRTPSFSPDGSLLAFVAPNAQDKETQDLWIWNWSTKGMERVLSGQHGLGHFVWSPAGDTIYLIAVPPREKPKTPPPYERFTDMAQRWGDFKDHPQAYALALKDKSLAQLTAGQTNVEDIALSPDGKTLALARGVFVPERPYFVLEIWRTALMSGASSRLLRWQRWSDLTEMAFSPDGQHLAFIAPLTDMPKGGAKPVEHMAYNLGVFSLDMTSGETKCLTENFAPSAGSQAIGALPGRRNLWWTLKGQLAFIADDRNTLRLFQTDGKGGAIAASPTPDPAMGSPDVAASGTGLAYLGSSLRSAPKLRYVDLASGEARTLWAPGEETYARVQLGKTEPFDATASDGAPIQGTIIFPPFFAPGTKYPVILAYYGGVSPFADAFRTEMVWLAGQGYLVYLVIPRGSVGYGVELADAHMNDWGDKAAEDILAALDKLLKEKPYADASKVGCFGGSYGGFMTLYLAGHSDRFGAAVDFFGISDITSYWGAGWWGFTYGDTAIANSYPWTRPDIFVKRSPVYFADKIKAPLLILHGDSDTNVPPAEADQMFTAMRVLGRTCEYVRFAGEDHGLHGKPSNFLASDRMMLEWFDKYLKGEPEAWGERWKNDVSPYEEEKK